MTIFAPLTGPKTPVGSVCFGRSQPDDVQHHQLQHDGHGQQHQRGEQAGAGAQEHLAQAGDDIAHRRDGRRRDGIGQLGGHMVHMAAMGTGGRHDGGVRDGGAVVAAHCAGQAGRNGDDQHLPLRERMADDGDEDGEGAPGRAGGKGQEHRHQKDDGRQQILQRSRRAVEQVGHVILGTQQVGHAGKGPRQRQDEHGADHGLEALRDAGREVLKGHHAAHPVEHEGEQQRDAAAQHQARRGVAVGEGGDEVHAFKEAAGVDEAEDAGRNEHQHRQNQVDDMAAGYGAVVHIVAVGAVFGGEEVALQRVVLVELHGAVVGAREDEEEDHDDGQQGVIVIRNGAQEHGKAVDARTFRHRGGDGRRPAGHRRDDADRGRRGVDEVGQLCAGDLLPVGHRPHDGAYGQAVEVVVHKDEHTQNKGHELRPRAGVDVGGRPAAKGRAAARLVHQGHQDAQHDQKDQNAHVAGVGQLGDHAAVFVEEQGVQGQFQVAVGKEQRTRRDAHQQRGVDLLGVQCQHDGHHRRQQGERRAVHGAGVGRRVGNGAGCCRRAPQQQSEHQHGARPRKIDFFHKI